MNNLKRIRKALSVLGLAASLAFFTAAIAPATVQAQKDKPADKGEKAEKPNRETGHTDKKGDSPGPKGSGGGHTPDKSGKVY